MTVVIQSETYTTGSGDRLELRPVCKVHVLVRFIRTVMFNLVYLYGYFNYVCMQINYVSLGLFVWIL